ncbi:MAG TPA: low affinity iron permease family protein [Dehalococcoidia bacterium]|nr:low affinity iron permease family protein [Dehalococcoidia bacterium]
MPGRARGHQRSRARTPSRQRRGRADVLSEAFRRFAQSLAHLAGTVGAFAVALLVVLLWAATGPLFGFSDTWQLVINTGTTVITFLMVFVIQNTQNRDSRALHAKLDELLIAGSGTNNRMVEAEDLSERDLNRLKDHYVSRAQALEQAANRRRQAARKQAGARGQNGATARPGRRPH